MGSSRPAYQVLVLGTIQLKVSSQHVGCMPPSIILHLAVLGLKHAVLFENITAAGEIMVASCHPSRHLSNHWMLDDANHMHENSLRSALGTST